MKTNGTLKLVYPSILLLALIFSFSTLVAQPDYSFKNPALIAGTDLQIGAQYRFSNIKPGVDGIITIADLGGNMTLDQLDGLSGFDEAFQPYIDCAAKKSGYVEFTLDFVIAGTKTPMVQSEVPLTAIDIDGEQPAEKLYEFDEFQEAPAMYVAYDQQGNSLNVKKMGSWYQALNKSAINYPGIDTVQRDVMFTAVYANVSSIRFRVGADNNTKGMIMRLRSVYFKKFAYSNSFLAISPLLSLSGFEKNNKVQLNWKLVSDHKMSKIVIERAATANQFSVAGEIGITPSNANQQVFSFADNSTLQGNAFYRLKLIKPDGSFQYSNILVFRSEGNQAKELKVYPNVVQSNTTINLTTTKSGIAEVRVIDLSGRIFISQKVNVQEGNNNFTLSNLDKLGRGNYVVAVQSGDGLSTQQIIKQ